MPIAGHPNANDDVDVCRRQRGELLLEEEYEKGRVRDGEVSMDDGLRQEKKYRE